MGAAKPFAARQTPPPTNIECGKTSTAVRDYRSEKEERKERWGYGVGSIPISTNHTFFLFFFLNSLPLHQVFKPLPTFFTKV
ncbi:hypothetical protein Hanom_Chr04g00303381 [Helianthus anomalus]